MARLIGMALLLIGAASRAFAGLTITPEIDASTGIAAVTLVAGGMLVLRARRRK